MKGSAQEKALLKKYRDGECTPAEKLRVEQWLVGLGRQDIPEVSSVSEKNILKTARKEVLKQTGTPRGRTVTMFRYASVAAMLVFIPLAYLFYNQLYKPQTPAEQRFSTLPGQQKIIVLPDSTEVTLNSSSSLAVGGSYNQKYRRVTLSGEAYFRVKHDKQRPFIVSTGKLQTQVLGTEFNVHAYTDEANIKVAVVQGRVKVSEQQNGVTKQLGDVLTHNLMLSYDVNSRRHVTTTADAEKLSAWKKGELYFEETGIQEIVKALSRRYNQGIELADAPLANCKYTISFSSGDALPKVLTVLGQLSGITYQTTQNKIIIHAKNCH
ncbi:FecR family protein [Mucilaginibacter gynuensis]|uniref:FecR family protein n=2 Tax=Mucilaginibacter gynuensis TaxID=1302236 RepID=A0ABP8GBG9_9SPHI